MQGISIKSYIGIGDGLQFSSLPENYFRHTGERLIDVSEPWFFDHNPFVVRGEKPSAVTEMWNFGPHPDHAKWEWPKTKTAHGVYSCNAEIYAALFKVKARLNRPRLYKFEDFRFADRKNILLQTNGRSHGEMPKAVIDHVLAKYGHTGCLYQIGLNDCKNIGIPRLTTPTLWGLAAIIAQARMVICLDSGPAWIAACYPDVVVKKLRTKPQASDFEAWMPLARDNIHSHWDDRCAQIFNISDDDVGFTQSYRKI